MTTQQTENQTMGIYGIYGTHTTEVCSLFNEENKKLLLQIVSTFEQDANAKGIKVGEDKSAIIIGVIVTATTVWFGMLPALGSGVAD